MFTARVRARWSMKIPPINRTKTLLPLTFRRVSESLFSIFNYSCKSDDESAGPPRDIKSIFYLKQHLLLCWEKFDHIVRWYLRNLFNLLSCIMRGGASSVHPVKLEILLIFNWIEKKVRFNQISQRTSPHFTLYFTLYIFGGVLKVSRKPFDTHTHTAISSLTSLWKCQIAIAHIPWIFWCNRSHSCRKRSGDLSCTGWITPLIEKQSKIVRLSRFRATTITFSRLI